jgi:hypothetical protein
MSCILINYAFQNLYSYVNLFFRIYVLFNIHEKLISRFCSIFSVPIILSVEFFSNSNAHYKNFK